MKVRNFGGRATRVCLQREATGHWVTAPPPRPSGAARHPSSHWRSDRPPPPHNYCLARQKIDWIVEIVDRHGRTFIRNVPFKANSQRKETIKRVRVRRYFPVMVQRAGNSPLTSRREKIKPGENEARPCALLRWVRLGQILRSGFYL